MTETPYTRTDLIDEAARQHCAATRDAEYGAVGEQMEGRQPWDRMTVDGEWTEALAGAQRQVHDLITGAADTSQWAVQCGDGGLRPQEPVGVRMAHTGDWEVAVQVALHPGLLDGVRAELVAAIHQAASEAVSRVLARTPAL